MFSLDLKGGKKLERKLNRMEKKVAAKFMLAAMKDAMQPVVPAAQARAPVDSGRMKRSIKVATSNKKRGLSAMVRTGTRRALRIPADDKYYYPAAIEYGTRKRAARSFLRAALSALKNQVLRAFGVNIDRSLRRA